MFPETLTQKEALFDKLILHLANEIFNLFYLCGQYHIDNMFKQYLSYKKRAFDKFKISKKRSTQKIIGKN